MTDITELERRITEALDRIGQGVDAMSAVPEAPAIDPAEVDTLREALESEKVANAQLEERVKSLHAQNDDRIRELENHIDTLKASAHEAKTQVQQLRMTNQHLQSSLTALREAATQGVADPHLINQAMMTELDGLRAVRDADRAELDDILSALQPHVTEPNNA